MLFLKILQTKRLKYVYKIHHKRRAWYNLGSDSEEGRFYTRPRIFKHLFFQNELSESTMLNVEIWTFPDSTTVILQVTCLIVGTMTLTKLILLFFPWTDLKNF